MLTIRKMKTKTEESKDAIINSELSGGNDDEGDIHSKNFIFININEDEDINPWVKIKLHRGDLMKASL